MKQLGFVFIVLAFCLVSLLVAVLVTNGMENKVASFLIGVVCGASGSFTGLSVAYHWYDWMCEKERSR